MNNNSSSREPRENNTRDLVDRISALPDSILGVILSNLPTKNAVATTILSKRWKSVWATVHNLDFYYEDANDEDQYMKFVQFVNRVLLLNDDGLLNKFRLVWEPVSIQSQQICSWINTAITRNVHDLSIVFLDVLDRPEILDTPISVFSCHSLQCLELSGFINVSSGIVVSLPKLETLKLFSVRFESKETFQKLITQCPMLNFLHLDLDFEEEEDDVIGLRYSISSSSLRRLVVGDDQWDSDITHSIELEAPLLEYLKIEGCIPLLFVKGNLSSLVEADLGIQLHDEEYFEDMYNSLAKRVHSFDRVKALTLSSDVIWALTNATISLSTKFTRLTKLKAEFSCCYSGSSLQDIMQGSDNLQVLEICKDMFGTSVEGHVHSKWIVPVEVPRCLSNKLKKISFEGYSGRDDEHKMISYMLEHGSVLEVINITYDTNKMKDNKLELVEMICGFRRKSPACEVKFITY